MQLIDQHTKDIMEECKKRARDLGLSFDEETLEFITTNQDLIELSPKIMVPTLYDYWVHDVDIIQGKGKYSIFPHNPFETVINTRPAVSFYNDNNPDWLNVMIFYHVLGHIDFFQNNKYFLNTWKDDFMGKALADKRRINYIRQELGEKKRWVDYIIEFTRSIDNLVNFYADLKTEVSDKSKTTKTDYFFSDFLNIEKDESSSELMKKVNEYNDFVKKYGSEEGDKKFLKKIEKNYPEFSSRYKKWKNKKNKKKRDLIEFLMNESPVINKEENWWMKEVMQIVRDTSVHFQPQIRTKICNEGWASLIHQYLFEQDNRVSTHETDYAVVNAKVVSNTTGSLNPYAIGNKLLDFLWEMGEKGKINNYSYQLVHDIEERKNFDQKTNKGWETLFEVRKNFNDFMLMNFLDKNDFQDFVKKNKLFVAGKKLNPYKRVWEYFIKSRRGEDYRQMLIDNLYHPPKIKYISNINNELYLTHVYEGRQLVTEYIENVLVGLEYLWGNPVKLETTEFIVEDDNKYYFWMMGETEDLEYKRQRVRYKCENRKIKREILEDENH